MNYVPTYGPSGGVEPVNVDVKLNALQGGDTPIAAGDVVRVTPSGGVLTTVSLATTAQGLPSQMFGVALEASTSNTDTILVRVSGIVEVKCHEDADANLALGVSGANAAHLTILATEVPAVGGAYTKQIGIALENTATTGDLTSVLFDGITGFSRGV